MIYNYMHTTYSIQPLFLFRLRGRNALFLVSLDSCVHQDTHNKIWCGCCVWGWLAGWLAGVMRATCQSAWAQVMSPLFLLTASDSVVVLLCSWLLSIGAAAASGTGCTTVSAGMIGGSCSRSYTVCVYNSSYWSRFFFFCFRHFQLGAPSQKKFY